ncbi:MAG: polysaccharide biosynthesis C-terminal domain-containing protein [Litorimonas sp.]
MLGKSMLAYLPVNITNIIASFGAIAILTRLLDDVNWGMYSLAMITMHAVHMLLFSWTEAAMARFQARAERNDDVNSHIKTIYMLALYIALGGFLLIILTLKFLPLDKNLGFVITIALSSTCLSLFINLGMEAHKASQRIKRYSLIYSSHTLVSFAIGILFVKYSIFQASGPFIGIIISLFLIGTLDLIYMLKQSRGGQFHAQKSKTYFKYGVPIGLSLVLTYALNSADSYMIAYLIDIPTQGKYSAGYNLSNRSLEIIFIWVAMAVTPMAITAFEKESSEVSQSIMKDFGATLLWLTLPAATGIALVSKDAGFILGESIRAEAVTVMPLIAFAGLINGFMNFYVHRAFMLSGKTTAFAWAMIPPVILNIGLNLILIPKFGMMGAVWATVICYAFACTIAIILARRYYPLPLPFKAAFEISGACLFMAVCVHFTPIPDYWPDVISLIVKAVIGGLAYIGICLSLNIANCRTVLQNILQKFRPENVSA